VPEIWGNSRAWSPDPNVLASLPTVVGVAHSPGVLRAELRLCVTRFVKRDSTPELSSGVPNGTPPEDIVLRAAGEPVVGMASALPAVLPAAAPEEGSEEVDEERKNPLNDDDHWVSFLDVGAAIQRPLRYVQGTAEPDRRRRSVKTGLEVPTRRGP
jgi:hypothetical protein